MMPRLAVLSLAAGLGLTGLAAPVRADLQDEMNVFFDSLGNTTDPTITSTARRGVIAGGSIQVRNRIVDTNLVTFTPPSFQAGCGGVDLFGGSFSYVSGDQIVPLFKAVASNAVGYAFQIGLSAICESCMGAIETMQKKVQALNQHFGNSCQLAQGIVNDGLAAAGYQRHTDASIINAVSGASEDIFAAQTDDALGTAQETSPDVVAEKISGNLIWRALAPPQEFSFPGGVADIELREAMMTVTGTVIVGTPAAGEDGATTPITVIDGNYLIFNAMIEGGDAVVLSCNGETGPNECLTPTKQTITLEGFEERANRLLLGEAGEPGIVTKMRDGGEALTDEEEALLINLPGDTYGLLVRLVGIGEIPAKVFVEQLIPHLTIEWSRLLSRDLIGGVTAMLTIIDSEHKADVQRLVDRARDHLYQEARQLQDAHGSIADLVGGYRDILAVTNPLALASPVDPTERP